MILNRKENEANAPIFRESISAEQPIGFVFIAAGVRVAVRGGVVVRGVL